MTINRERRIMLGVIFCVGIGLLVNYAVKSSFAWDGASGFQDVRSLDRRISSLEQRLYSIETSINRLEQSSISQRTPALPSSTRDPEINVLRGEIQALQLHLNEVECGLVKLDERTLTPAAREARRSLGKTADPCRLNPATPVRFSDRP